MWTCSSSTAPLYGADGGPDLLYLLDLDEGRYQSVVAGVPAFDKTPPCSGFRLVA